jgi:hypothetical protein
MTSELIFGSLAYALVQIIRALPGIIWAIRCRSSSSAYRCPPLFPSGKQCRGGDSGCTCTGCSQASAARTALPTQRGQDRLIEQDLDADSFRVAASGITLTTPKFAAKPSA